jgi:hypothetical protein
MFPSATPCILSLDCEATRQEMIEEIKVAEEEAEGDVRGVEEKLKPLLLPGDHIMYK